MNKPQVLVVGGGSIGERHLRCFLKTGECAVALCEPDTAKREQLAQRYALTRTFADFGQVVWSEVAVAVIATPTPFHLPQSLAAARAGCHLLCEKPLSDKLDGIQELIDTLRAQQKVGATAFTMRSVAALRRIKELIDQGTIGEPRIALANVSQHFPSVRPDYQRIYFAKLALGGGTLFDMSPHLLNLFEWFLGPEQEVSAVTARLALAGIETDDTALLNLRFRAGGLGQISVTMFARHSQYKIAVHGLAGSVVYDHVTGELLLQTNGTPAAPPALVEQYPAQRDDLYVAQARRFLAATRGETAVACTLEEGRQTLRAVLAAQQAAASGQVSRL